MWMILSYKIVGDFGETGQLGFGSIVVKVTNLTTSMEWKHLVSPY